MVNQGGDTTETGMGGLMWYLTRRRVHKGFLQWFNMVENNTSKLQIFINDELFTNNATVI